MWLCRHRAPHKLAAGQEPRRYPTYSCRHIARMPRRPAWPREPHGRTTPPSAHMAALAAPRQHRPARPCRYPPVPHGCNRLHMAPSAAAALKTLVPEDAPSAARACMRTSAPCRGTPASPKPPAHDLQPPPAKPHRALRATTTACLKRATPPAPRPAYRNTGAEPALAAICTWPRSAACRRAAPAALALHRCGFRCAVPLQPRTGSTPRSQGRPQVTRVCVAARLAVGLPRRVLPWHRA